MSRRLGSIISAGALAVGLAAPTLLAQPAQARRADQVASLRIMQLNIKTTLSTPNWIADARKAMSMSDIADFNEASRQVHLDALRNLLEASGWDGWWPAKAAGKENPITWNASKFTLVSAKTRQVTPWTRHLTPARGINTVVLRQRSTGRLIAVVATHTINKGAPDGGKKISKLRTPILIDEIAKLHRAIKQAQQVTPYVFATGDWNVNHMRDRFIRATGLPYDVLSPTVNFDMPIGRTYKPARTELDYIVTAKGGDNAPFVVDGAIVKGFHSDHFGVNIGYAFPNDPDVPPADPAPTSTVTFARAMVRNRPHANKPARRTVLRLVRRAIANSEAGTAIHLTTGRLEDQKVITALRRAANRGVKVQVVQRRTGLTSQANALRTMLGTRPPNGSWFVVGCASSGCQKAARKMPQTTLLVSRSGLTSAVRVAVDRALNKHAVRRPTTARVTNDLGSYNTAFNQFFGLVGGY